MRKFALAVMLGAFALGLAGCASSGRNKHSPTHSASVTATRSDSHTVRVIAGSRTAIDGVNLRNNARLLSPTRLAIMTWGSTTCPAVPNRLVVETPDTIRIHLATGRWQGKLPVAHLPPDGACTADHTSAVIVIAIDPRQINVHHRLTIRLDYYRVKKPEIRTAPPLSAGGKHAGAAALPAPLLKRITALARRTARSLGDPSVKTAQVYGPSSRVTLVRASSGDWVQESARERHLRFYLIVLRGHFVCDSCSVPAGAKPPTGTIATQVWSPVEGGTDGGVSNHLYPAMARLHRPTLISLT